MRGDHHPGGPCSITLGPALISSNGAPCAPLSTTISIAISHVYRLTQRRARRVAAADGHRAGHRASALPKRDARRSGLHPLFQRVLPPARPTRLLGQPSTPSAGADLVLLDRPPAPIRHGRHAGPPGRSSRFTTHPGARGSTFLPGVPGRGGVGDGGVWASGVARVAAGRGSSPVGVQCPPVGQAPRPCFGVDPSRLEHLPAGSRSLTGPASLAGAGCHRLGDLDRVLNGPA